MLKKIFPVFLLALAPLLWSGEACFAADFVDLQKTPWGMNRKDTAKALGVKLPLDVTKDSGLTVKGFELGGFDGTMGYLFLDDRLIEIHFRIGGLAGGKFTPADAIQLRDRLAKQFDRNYGERVVNDAACDNVADCRYFLWNKDHKTAVGLFFVNSAVDLNLGAAYMERSVGNVDGTGWQPYQGLAILPPETAGKKNQPVKPAIAPSAPKKDIQPTTKAKPKAAAKPAKPKTVKKNTSAKGNNNS